MGKKRGSSKRGSGRTVSRRTDGTWANKKNGAKRASSTHRTQAEATKAAREALRKEGGGELTVKGVDNKIRSKDTVPDGNDPYPPKG